MKDHGRKGSFIKRTDFMGYNNYLNDFMFENNNLYKNTEHIPAQKQIKSRMKSSKEEELLQIVSQIVANMKNICNVSKL